MIRTGRHKESLVWQYFQYNKLTDKSECQLEISGRKCGEPMSGCNPTNLKGHIKAKHPDIYKKLESEEDARKKYNESKRKVEVNSPPTAAGRQSLLTQVLKPKQLWQADSVEYRNKLESIASCFAETGLPLRILDQPAFKNMCATLDPKLVPPGHYSLI